MNIDWEKVRYFKLHEFHDADKLNPLLIYSLDALRHAAGKPIKINSDYRDGDPGQQQCEHAVAHPQRARDGVHERHGEHTADECGDLKADQRPAQKDADDGTERRPR